MAAWYQGSESSGFSRPVQQFGHEMAFASPFPGMSWMVGYNPVDSIVVFTISPRCITTVSPFLIQDGETQETDMKVLSAKTSLQLIGTGPVELFYDPYMETKGIHRDENALAFDNDPTGKVTPTTPGITV